MHPSRRESYRLDAVADSELGETKLRYTGTISSLWKNDPATLVAYNRKDVALWPSVPGSIRRITSSVSIGRSPDMSAVPSIRRSTPRM